MSETKKQTVIEDGTEFEGVMSSSGAVTLSGTLKGELLAPALTITSSGSAQGSVNVERLVCEGEISGKIEAKSVELKGKVSDQTTIVAETLEVRISKPGKGVRVTFGDCELQVGDRPADSGKPKNMQTGKSADAKPVAREPVHAADRGKAVDDRSPRTPVARHSGPASTPRR